MSPLKPTYNRLHSINLLLSPNVCTFSDTEPFLHSYCIFPTLLNLNFLTWRIPKFKVPKILPGTLSQTQIKLKEPKRSKIDLHLDQKTAEHILLVKAAFRWFDFYSSDFTCFFQKLQNLATYSNHLKTPWFFCFSSHYWAEDWWISCQINPFPWDLNPEPFIQETSALLLTYM